MFSKPTFPRILLFLKNKTNQQLFIFYLFFFFIFSWGWLSVKQVWNENFSIPGSEILYIKETQVE